MVLRQALFGAGLMACLELAMYLASQHLSEDYGQPVPYFPPRAPKDLPWTDLRYWPRYVPYEEMERYNSGWNLEDGSPITDDDLEKSFLDKYISEEPRQPHVSHPYKEVDPRFRNLEDRLYQTIFRGPKEEFVLPGEELPIDSSIVEYNPEVPSLENTLEPVDFSSRPTKAGSRP